MLKKIIKYLLNKISHFFHLSFFIKRNIKNSNYEIIDKNYWMPFFYFEKYFSLYKVGLQKSKQEYSDNFSKNLRFFSLTQLVKYVLSKQNLQNYNFAECGCWYGHSTYIISKILKEFNFKNKFYIFDSFEGGLSDLSNKDQNLLKQMSEKEVEIQKNYCKSNEEHVKNILKDFEFIKIFNGWIPEKFHYINEQKFQFVHLDVDLYEPTKESLNFFFPRLVEGGTIVCDDYNISIFPGAKKAWDEYFHDKKENYKLFYEAPFGGCFIIK